MDRYLHMLPKATQVVLVTGMWDFNQNSDGSTNIISPSVHYLSHREALEAADDSNWGRGAFGHPDVFGFFVRVSEHRRQYSNPYTELSFLMEGEEGESKGVSRFLLHSSDNLPAEIKAVLDQEVEKSTTNPPQLEFDDDIPF